MLERQVSTEADQDGNKDRERKGRKKKHFVSFSREKNGGHPWLRIWGFNIFVPFFQSASARLESLTAAEMRAANETVGSAKRNTREQNQGGKQDTKVWKE